jgi:hypothetical protein
MVVHSQCCQCFKARTFLNKGISKRGETCKVLFSGCIITWAIMTCGMFYHVMCYVSTFGIFCYGTYRQVIFRALGHYVAAS